MLYDGDVFGARVIASEVPQPGEEEEEHHVYCNHLIAIQTRWVAFDLA